MNNEEKISTICAWCKDWVYKADAEHSKTDMRLSHGICVPCDEKVREEMKESGNDS